MRAVDTGGLHACARKTDGSLWCWGLNDVGQLGDGTTTNRSTPTPVTGMTSDVWVIATGFEHTCARKIKTDGSVSSLWCWGLNYNGQLGDGTTTNRSTPTLVTGMTSSGGIVATGAYHTCAIKPDGDLWCWGANLGGALGDGTTTNRSTPTLVTGLAGRVTAVAAGEHHTCALKGDGSLWCWGRNEFGALGNGGTTDGIRPIPVTDMASGVTAVAAGGHHTCTLKSDGSLWCWGSNGLGELGDGTTTDRSTPIPVTGMASRVRAVATDAYHTCALKTDGSLWCWGWNHAGQLGDGTTTGRSTPIPVIGMASGVGAVAAGFGHTCALKSDGSLWCWGRNDYGQLGDGTEVEPGRAKPVQVSGCP